MPLLDHFHPPLSRARHWEALHARWAAAIADTLNDDLLPEGYFAEAPVHSGRVEVDVATFEEANGGHVEAGSQGGPTVAQQVWSPPQPAALWPAVFPEYAEVLVYQDEGGPSLVGAVELISPANKDRPETRRAFAIKCAAYLQSGVGVLIIDVVTSRQANLHNAVAELLAAPAESLLPGDAPLYAAAYRPIRRDEIEHIETWTERLALGRDLPEMPLALHRGLCLPIDLEATYSEACRRIRLPG
jgi:hypothetical protein